MLVNLLQSSTKLHFLIFLTSEVRPSRHIENYHHISYLVLFQNTILKTVNNA